MVVGRSTGVFLRELPAVSNVPPSFKHFSQCSIKIITKRNETESNQRLNDIVLFFLTLSSETGLFSDTPRRRPRFATTTRKRNNN